MACAHERSVLRVRVEGDLTVRTAAQQKAKLLPALRTSYTVIELDLTEVSEIDMAGIQLSLLGCNVATVVGGALRLAVLSPAVREAIGLLKLGPVFEQAASHCALCGVQTLPGMQPAQMTNSTETV